MIKAVIFDFDGLILDTETAWYDAYKEVLWGEFRFDLPLDAFVQCVGSSDAVLFSYLEKEIGTSLNIEKARQMASTIHMEKVKSMEARVGVVDYLRDAKEKNLAIALTTSSTRRWVEHHLSNLQLLTYFDHLITKDDVARVKPAPDLFLKTIDVLKVETAEAIVFEDSLNGLIAAREVGIPTVIIPNSVTAASAFEDYQLKIPSMEEMCLTDVLASVNEK